ncbi:MAG: alpha/beta hydrolase [Gammaproteobacteria bacterium]|nr:alpha/beta hydrolase [Gammaproteobacteria bacterium]
MKTVRFQGSGGLTLAADVGGDPASVPVILMHGGGQTRHSWGRAARDLVDAGFYVISLDLRGHGESDWSPGGDYSMDAFVGDLCSVVATLPSPPALVGASLGGATSLLAAGEGQLSARALVLVDLVPKMEREGAQRIGEFMRANPHGFADLEEVADAVSRYISHRPRPSNIEGLRRNVRLRTDGRLYWHWDPKIAENTGRREPPTEFLQRLTQAASRVRVPAMLVRGKLSDVVSEDGVEDLRRLIPHVEFVDVAGAGHMVAGDDNDAFNDAVEGFLARLR